jgi:nitrile hydratase accessory protein
MPDPRREAVLAWEGALSPPRRNGELVFEALWESRVFGLTMTLYEAGAFAWPEFRDRLIAEIAAWEREHGAGDDPFHYWSCWLRAFERLVTEKELCTYEAIDARVAALAARPPGHDHRGAAPEDATSDADGD